MATYISTNKTNSTWGSRNRSLVNDLLLQEDGFYLLTENGDRIILEQSIPSLPNWNNRTKN